MSRLRQRLKSSSEDGFTLIELLIVIVILGILAGIAIFAVSAFQSDAKTACNNANSRIDATVSAANSITAGAYTNGTTCAP
jgi:prepilin-type N-terminal cleavage/methylation domain-containing protein